MIKTSVIGLGAMGAGIAANLHRAGILAGAWNRTPERGRLAAEAGGFPFTEDLAKALQDAKLILISVSADRDLIQISERILPLLHADQVVLDTSTVNLATAKSAAKMFDEICVHFLDAPVSGGKEGARNASMVMMVGGDPAVLERVMPALQVISRQVTHMGPIGSGQTTKAVNQIMCAGINQAVCEALAFAQHSELNMDKVIDVVSGGAAGNWFLQHRGRSMCAGDFAPGFRMALHHKDLKICQAMLAEHTVTLPTVEMTLVHYERLLEQGYGDEDISTLFRLKQTMFN